MNISKKLFLWAWILAVTMGVSVFAQQTEQVERKLTFEVAGEVKYSNHMANHSLKRVQDAFQGVKEFPELIEKVTHIGVVAIYMERNLSYNTDPWLEAIPQTRVWQTMSQEQRDLIGLIIKEFNKVEEQWGSTFYLGRPFRISPDNFPAEPGFEYWIVAVSEDDAKKMAEAVIEWRDKEAESELERVKINFSELKKDFAEWQEKEKEKDAELNRVDTLFQQKMKEYRQMNIFLEMSESEILSDAQEGMKEFSILLKTIEFELIGLQAKIDSINNYKTGGLITDASTLLKLEQILVTTEVERAGLLAKKKAVQSAVVLPQEMINLNSQIKKLSTRTFFRGVSLSGNMQDIEEYEELLANPTSNMKPAKVIGNKVVIYPFRAK